LTGTAPVYDKDNFSVRQPDGTIQFLNRSQINSTINFGFVQPIAATGGTVSVNTSLTRFDELIGRTKTYSGTPIYIQLQQPLFGFNNFKWQNRIAPLKLKKTKLEQQNNRFTIAYNAAVYFFEIATLQTDLEIISENITVNSKNLIAAQKRKDLGVGDEDKLLQLQATGINLQQQLQKINLQLQSTIIKIKNDLLIEDTSLSVKLPQNFPTIKIGVRAIMDSIKMNNVTKLENEIARLELLAEKDRLTKEKTQINVLVSFGLNNSGNTVQNIFNQPNDQQRLNIGFSIPITDWGKRKNTAAINKLNMQLLQLNEQQQTRGLETEIQLTLLNLYQIKTNYLTTIELENIGKKQYERSVALFNNGKITFLELQAAALNNANYKKELFNNIKEYYLLVYKLEQICNCKIQ
jgi:outer membrane protein